MTSRIPIPALIALFLTLALIIAPTALADHSVKILTEPPADGGTYTMKVEVAKFKLVPVGQETSNVKGEGHIHYLLNGDVAPGDYATTKTSFTYRDLKPGDVLSVELVNHDHTPTDPDVKQTQTVGGSSEESPGVALTFIVLGAVLAMLVVRRMR